MSNMFNNNISGGAQNIAQGSSNISQTVNASAFATGDTAAFLHALSDTGEISNADVDELSAAIDEDNPDGTPKGANPIAGPKVQGWMSRLGLAAGGVTGKVGISAAGGVAASLIRQFFGIA